jgi:hypothetical protein
LQHWSVLGSNSSDLVFYPFFPYSR